MSVRQCPRERSHWRSAAFVKAFPEIRQTTFLFSFQRGSGGWGEREKMAPQAANTLASPQVMATSDNSRLIGCNSFGSSDSDSPRLTRPITPAIRDIRKDFERVDSGSLVGRRSVSVAKLERAPMSF